MTVLIIGAMDVEIQQLCKTFSAEKADENLFICDNGQDKIVISKCGVGKVNAAALTQKLICRYNPDMVINTGAAGAISGSLGICELVISSCLAYHDFTPLDLLNNYPPFTTRFKADERLIAVAEEACRKQGFPFQTGVIVSGDSFVSSNAQKQQIDERFSALCTEMEGAAVAHVCLLEKKPFLVIRSISDFADDNAETVNHNEAVAAKRAAYVTEYVIKQITAQKGIN